MKQYWQKFVLKIDALSLRERVIIFVAAVALVLAVVNALVIEPQFKKQKALSQSVTQTQKTLAAVQSEIEQKLKNRPADPDAPNRARLAQTQEQAKRMQLELMESQKGLVAPQRMTQVLEAILRRHGNLSLVSLKTLPPANVVEAAAKTAQDKPAAAKPKPPAAPGAVYRHEVEIVVEGSYPDMLSYMQDLERSPWQIYWGHAQLRVGEYPKATLSLNLFTLSLDQAWLNI